MALFLLFCTMRVGTWNTRLWSHGGAQVSCPDASGRTSYVCTSQDHSVCGGWLSGSELLLAMLILYLPLALIALYHMDSTHSPVASGVHVVSYDHQATAATNALVCCWLHRLSTGYSMQWVSGTPWHDWNNSMQQV